ncbi:MAG: DUF4340 domain-containing protein [Saprospiraceae bacterium]|jgi:hypothetical protein|nr:DUF4340 domain-containing protein [Saprospiraceae bacterium]
MKRTLILLILFLVLGTGAYFLVKNKDNSSTTSWNEAGDFAVDNVDEIYKIFIADRQDYRVLLERKNGYWTYNKKFKAKNTQINDLLNTIRGVRMKYTTPRGAEDNMRKNLATSGVKVEIYDKNDNKLKVYYVGGSTANSLGTYYIMEGSTEPYVMHIPSFQGMLKGKFMKQDDDWKDLIMYGEQVEDIQSVSVAYPKQKSKSFIIDRKGAGEYAVKPFYEGTPKIEKPVLNAAVEKYLTGYSVMMAEAFENKNSLRDSIVNTLPFASISITNTQGNTKVGRLFPIPQLDQYGNPVLSTGVGMKGKQSIYRYFADYKDEYGDSFRLVQHRNFERLFWSYDYFFSQ